MWFPNEPCTESAVSQVIENLWISLLELKISLQYEDSVQSTPTTLKVWLHVQAVLVSC